MIFKAFSLKTTFFLLFVSNIVLSNHNIEDILVGPMHSFDSEECTPGESCDDGNSCTENDRYDRWCNCSGTYQDEDNDGVCDAEDKCPGGDDNIDKNDDGTPDDCEEKEKICSECEEDINGEITLCWIPTNKFNLKTIRGDCEFLHKFFDENGNLKGKSQCGPCDCAMIGDKDTDGDGICDGNDDCPDKPDDDKCGCDDQDSDGDGICDNDDICPDHDDNEDLDEDGTPDGCDLCPENPDYTDEVAPCGCDDQDTDNDGICDSEDCLPEDDSLPTDPGTSCDDNDENTEHDVIQADGCSCLGTPIEECEISAIIDDVVCDDNGTPAYADDDTYSFTLKAELLSGDATKWEGSFSNAYLGAFAIGPTAFGDKIDIGPIPAGSFTPSNVSPPILIEGGLSIDIQVNAVGDFECYDSGTVDSPGTCACDDADGDGICDEDDCLPDNPDLPSDMEIACDDGNPNTINDVYAIGSCECKGEPIDGCPDSDDDGVCDEDDVCPGYDDNNDFDNDGIPNKCDCAPDVPGLPSSFIISCDDGDPNTINDVYAIGACECKGEPIDGCSDSDDDGVCDEDDVCPGYDDNNDFDNDGIPNKCDCAPDVPGLPSSFIISCDDGDPNTINDVYAIGSCECAGEPISCIDSDGDDVCDDDDMCEGYDDNIDSDDDGTPDGCDQCPNNSDRVEEGPCGCDQCPVDVCEEICTPTNVNSEYEWIDKVSINALENESGDDGGYGDYRDMSISLGHGDSVSLWMFPAFLEDVCELSLHIYADWNQDCDFEDEDELIAWHKTVSENGADIAIPEHAKEGNVTIRFLLHNGRIRSGCQDYIDGEVEDYTLSIFTRDTQSFKNSSKKISLEGKSAIKISPNPVSDKEYLFVENSNINNLNIGFKIFSIDGTLIQSSTLNSGMNRISTSTYSPGIYIVETSDGINTEQQKIVIQN